MRLTKHKTIRPDVISASRTKTHTRTIIKPQTMPPRLFLRYFQSFSTPSTLNAIVIDNPALVTKHCRNAAMSITTVSRCRSCHPTNPTWFIFRNTSLTPLRGTRLTEDPTCTTF